MPEINDYDPIADGNALAPPNGFPEDMEYSDVNNSAREVMAVLARNYRDENGSLSATGINDLTVSANGVYPMLYQGLRLGFRAANNNTGAMTLTLNNLPAAQLLNTAGAPMEANSIIQNLVHYVVYNGSAFQLVTNGFTFPGGGPGLFSAASPNITPEGPDRVALLDNSNGSAPSFASIDDIRTAIELFNASNPAAAPALGDFLHFRDISDVNLPKTATIQEVLDTDPTIYRSDDQLLSPSLTNFVPFSTFGGSIGRATFSTVQTLLTAGRIGSVNLNVFTSSGTYIKPSNLVAALVICTGGGGGGAGVGATGANVHAGGTGGGGGAVAISLFPEASLSASEAYTVGAGGAGGIGLAGNSGGSTSFAGISGAGGRFGFIQTQNIAGGEVIFSQATTPVIATGGQINLDGGRGGPVLISPENTASGFGGSNFWGANERGVRTGSTTQNGRNGNSFGAGGSGAATVGSQPAGNGGDGADGSIVMLEFLS